MGSHVRISSELAAMRIQNMEKNAEAEEAEAEGEGGPTINGIALFLAWAGMAISVVLSFGAGTTYFNPDDDEVTNVFGSSTSTRFLAFTQLLLNILLFRYYFLLRRSVKADDVLGMMSDIKIGCYIMTSLEVAGCIGGMFVPLSLSTDVMIVTFTVAISGISLLFSFLLVYGVARQQSGPVLIYLLYKALLIFILLVALAALAADFEYLSSFQYVFGLLVITKENYIFIIAFFYVFSTSFILLHYNILVVNKAENSSRDRMKHRNIQFINKSDNKDWSENTLNHI